MFSKYLECGRNLFAAPRTSCVSEPSSRFPPLSRCGSCDTSLRVRSRVLPHFLVPFRLRIACSCASGGVPPFDPLRLSLCCPFLFAFWACCTFLAVRQGLGASGGVSCVLGQWGSWAWAVCPFTGHQRCSASPLLETCGNLSPVRDVPRPFLSSLHQVGSSAFVTQEGPYEGQSLGRQAAVIL